MELFTPQKLSILFAILIGQSAHATTGYFFHGYGVKAQGNAGVSIANFNDAMTIANNPAGLSWVDDQVNIGATVFKPERSADIHGNLAGANGNYDGNKREYFVLPEIAIRKQINDQVALGLAVYGNGGMNTGYKNNPFSAFGNTGTAGVDLKQIFISPAVAWKFTEHQSIGIASKFLYQEFSAKGISGFSAFSANGQNLSNNGTDSSTGVGFQIGWSGKFIDDHLIFGLNYASKIKAGHFDKYSGLFANSGSFDVPESYGAGLSYQATAKLKLSADVVRINYSDVDSVGQSFSVSSILAGNAFGTKNGPGFGWNDINIYRIGATYEINPAYTLRVGYSHNDQPIKKDQTFLNILAPGVIQDHVSIGGGWKIDPKQELDLAYTYGFKKKVKGQNSISPAFGGGEADIEMDQHILAISYSYKF